VVALRAVAIAGLAMVAVAGASVAGIEKALGTQSPGGRSPGAQQAAGPYAPAPPGPAVVAPPAPGLAVPGPPVPGPPSAGLPSAAPGSPLSLPSDPAAPPPCASTVRICVQLSTSSAWLRTDTDGVRGPVRMRHGRPDSPTPVGTFRVQSKDAAHVNSTDGSPMPFALFFDQGYAIYQADLTEPSAGSVRLAPGTAEAFFHTVSVGDLIEVVS
jgi:lipoprotein-anchoring transpeptidase ErfK/SrfK